MAETKETKQEAPLIPFPLLAAAYLLFFCLECVLAVEVRSVAFFSDSIIFLEGASVSVLMWPRLAWSLQSREAFARFSRTMILVPTCFMFWMIAANYYGAEVPSAVPMAVIGAVLLLTNIACLMMLRRGMSVHPPDFEFEGSKSYHHERCDHPGRISDVGIWDHVAGRHGRPWYFMHERGRG